MAARILEDHTRRTAFHQSNLCAGVHCFLDPSVHESEDGRCQCGWLVTFDVDLQPMPRILQDNPHLMQVGLAEEQSGAVVGSKADELSFPPEPGNESHEGASQPGDEGDGTLQRDARMAEMVGLQPDIGGGEGPSPVLFDVSAAAGEVYVSALVPEGS